MSRDDDREAPILPSDLRLIGEAVGALEGDSFGYCDRCKAEGAAGPQGDLCGDWRRVAVIDEELDVEESWDLCPKCVALLGRLARARRLHRSDDGAVRL